MKPCLGYQMSRRSMLGASGATLFGLQLSELVARAGEAEQTSLFFRSLENSSGICCGATLARP